MRSRAVLTVALVLALAALVAQAQPAASFSATTVRELGDFLANLPTGFYAIAPADAKRQMDAMDVFVLDVREAAEFQAERIQGAVLIPIRELPRRLAEVPKGKPVLVYCKSGHRGALAMVYLMGQGYSVRNIGGGLDGWKAAGLPVVK